MKNNLIILLITLTLVACDKKSDDIRISPNNLTICPSNTICSYTFLDGPEVINPHLPRPPYRSFSFSQISGNQCYTEFKIDIKHPTPDQSFKLNHYNTSNGEVYYDSSCDIVKRRAVEWNVKGVKIPTAINEKAKWLIEAKITLAQPSIAPQKTETISFKQYFYQE